MQNGAFSAVNFYRCLYFVLSGEMSKESIVRLRSVYMERRGRDGSTEGGSNRDSRDRNRQREAAKSSERNGRMIFSLAV